MFLCYYIVGAKPHLHCTGLALIASLFGYVVRPHFFGLSILDGTGAPCRAPSIK